VLTRPLSGDDEADTIESYFVSECVSLFGPDPLVEWCAVTSGLNGEHLERATTRPELARALARSAQTGHGLPEIVEALNAFASEDRPGKPPVVSEWARHRISVENVREGDSYSEYDGVIGERALKSILDAAYVTHTFSASELNVYGHCPFRFFALRVLGPPTSACDRPGRDLWEIRLSSAPNLMRFRYRQGRRDGFLPPADPPMRCRIPPATRIPSALQGGGTLLRPGHRLPVASRSTVWSSRTFVLDLSA